MLFEFGNRSKRFIRSLSGQPAAEATIRGDKKHPAIKGAASFYDVGDGVIVAAELSGLPTGNGPCDARVLGFHIHTEGNCTGNAEDPFAAVGPHYNPNECPHPQHAGDLPPLFSNRGFAWMAFYTNRFRIEDIIGRSIIVHDSPDDFTSQPAGNSGSKIACGTIQRNFQKV